MMTFLSPDALVGISGREPSRLLTLDRLPVCTVLRKHRLSAVSRRRNRNLDCTVCPDERVMPAAPVSFYVWEVRDITGRIGLRRIQAAIRLPGHGIERNRSHLILHSVQEGCDQVECFIVRA